MSLEDETGITNLIVWPSVQLAQDNLSSPPTSSSYKASSKAK
jgi:hypothetical protein